MFVRAVVVAISAGNTKGDGSRFVFRHDHNRAQEMLQTSFVFRMVSHQTMDLTKVVTDDHVESNACDGGE